jgi:hypothetical protein
VYNPANFFAELFPQLEERLLVEHGEDWWEDGDFHAAAQAAQADVEAGTFAPDFEHDDSTPEGQRERMIAMRGIDAAYDALNAMHRAGPVPPALAISQQCLELHGRFNDDAGSGLVLPRVAWTKDRDNPPLLLRCAFRSLTFAAPQDLRRSVLRTAPARMRMSRELRREGIVVGCVPAAEDITEIAFTHGRDRTGEWYAGEMRDTPTIRDRFEAVLEEADAQGVHAMVLPELTCCDGLLEFWGETLKSRHRASDRALRWAMVGTGNLANGHVDLSRTSETGERERATHVNAAALIDAATGEPVVIQRKQFPFDIEPHLMEEDYPLPFASGTATLRERIKPGHGIDVVDLGAARLAILICEDLSRSDVLLDELRAVGVSHILAPVFSKPTMPFHWEQHEGGDWVGGSGATVVIANSPALGRLIEARRRDAAPRPLLHTALVVTPWGWRAQRAAVGDPLLRFVLKHEQTPEACDDPDGSAPVTV